MSENHIQDGFSCINPSLMVDVVDYKAKMGGSTAEDNIYTLKIIVVEEQHEFQVPLMRLLT